MTRTLSWKEVRGIIRERHPIRFPRLRIAAWAGITAIAAAAGFSIIPKMEQARATEMAGANPAPIATSMQVRTTCVATISVSSAFLLATMPHTLRRRDDSIIISEEIAKAVRSGKGQEKER